MIDKKGFSFCIFLRPGEIAFLPRHYKINFFQNCCQNLHESHGSTLDIQPLLKQWEELSILHSLFWWGFFCCCLFAVLFFLLFLVVFDGVLFFFFFFFFCFGMCVLLLFFVVVVFFVLFCFLCFLGKREKTRWEAVCDGPQLLCGQSPSQTAWTTTVGERQIQGSVLQHALSFPAGRYGCPWLRHVKQHWPCLIVGNMFNWMQTKPNCS